MGLQQCENQRRGRMEGSIQDQQRIIQTNGYVLRTMQLFCNISEYDGPHVLQYDRTRIPDHLHGRSPYSCRKQRRTKAIHQTSPPTITGKRYVLQTTEM